jgi:hypothetical protein
MMLVAIIGASTDDPRVHGFIVGSGVLLYVAFATTVMLEPGSLID